MTKRDAIKAIALLTEELAGQAETIYTLFGEEKEDQLREICNQLDHLRFSLIREAAR